MQQDLFKYELPYFSVHLKKIDQDSPELNDKYENDYNYTATFNNETKGGAVCVYQPTEVALNFSDNVHSVVFQDWNNYVLKTEFVESGGSATAPSDPYRPSYIFEGWDTEFSNVSSDITITTVYRLNT